MTARFSTWHSAFDHPVTLWATIVITAVLLMTPVAIRLLTAAGRIDAKLHRELWSRYYSWLVLVPLLVGPVLLGSGWVIVAVLLLSLACYREFARATGLFRERSISAIVALGILLLAFASFDVWYEFFVALFPLVVALIAMVGILPDRPKGYVQRVALGVFAFTLFGVAMGHLGYLANDRNHRPILVLILLTVELNDVFAFIVGKSLGGPKLAPGTSPGKTMSGSLGAVVLTTALTATLGHYTFAGSPIDTPLRLCVLGITISVLGQFGDLMLSSVKRDIGIKDMGVVIPGHGGLLDRFDSLILVAPAVFHYVGYFVGIGVGEPRRIFTGG